MRADGTPTATVERDHRDQRLPTMRGDLANFDLVTVHQTSSLGPNWRALRFE